MRRRRDRAVRMFESRRRSVRRQRSRARQPLESAVGAIRIEVERIDHAGTREREARLALQERQVVDETDARRGDGDRACRTANKCRDLVRFNAREIRCARSAVSTSTSGSSAYAPREPLRTTRASMRLAVSAASTAAATASAPSEHALVSFGTKMRAVMAACPSNAATSVSNRSRRHAAVNRIADAHRRSARAIAEAIRRFERYASVGDVVPIAMPRRLLRATRARGNRLPGTLLPGRSAPRDRRRVRRAGRDRSSQRRKRRRATG